MPKRKSRPISRLKIRGSLPRRAMALVLEWAADHRDELLEDWNLCSRMQAPKAIEPLK